MNSKDNHKEFADQDKNIDREINEALERIISRAKKQNSALHKVLKMITKQDKQGN